MGGMMQVLCGQMAQCTILLTHIMFSITLHHTVAGDGGVDEGPRFISPIENTTVSVGRDARLSCVVENLSTFKVAWIYKGTGGRTVLTVSTQVITKNPRISATQEAQAWVLTVTNLTKKDQGVYMCQVNTKPVRKQLGFLRVVVPPSIVDSTSSSDMTVNEGSDVLMTCDARGDPQPAIRWVREDGRRLTFNTTSADEHMGHTLSLGVVGRNNTGAYMCIATNGVPPSVSKRIILNVNFPPVMLQEGSSGRVGVPLEGVINLECRFQVRPLDEVSWFHGSRELTTSDNSITITTTSLDEDTGLWRSVLSLQTQDNNDFGQYRCSVRNSLGISERILHVIEITTTTTTTTTTSTTTTTTAPSQLFHIKTSTQGPRHKSSQPPMVPQWQILGFETTTIFANYGMDVEKEEKEAEGMKARNNNHKTYHTQLSFESLFDMPSCSCHVSSSSWLVTSIPIIVSIIVKSSSS